MARTAHHRSSWVGRITILGMCYALIGHVVPASAVSIGISDRPVAEAKTTGQRFWQIRDFSYVKLVPHESGVPANQHPATIPSDVLRKQLQAIEVAQDGDWLPLFGSDELTGLIAPLAQALAAAGAEDDILLASVSRRGGGLLSKPTALTARMFVQDGRLQLIVHDARLDFYDAYRGTSVAPQFTFGSRRETSLIRLRGPARIEARRGDWLSVPLVVERSGVTSDKGEVSLPGAAQDANPVSDIERRLEILKRLHERGLISDEEHRQKRSEILQRL